jgi:nucleoside 2-deoxyribosyltransferase
VARGVPVVGYLASADFLKDRGGRLFGPLGVQAGVWQDSDGNLVENFDHSVNLMLAESCVIVVGGFEEALKKMVTVQGVAHAVS